MTATSATCVFPDSDTRIPRFREAGEVTLDLYHRDARIADRWLGLAPYGFDLLWRLAENPGACLTPGELRPGARDNAYEPETGSVAAAISRVRAQLAPFGLAGMLASHAEGGWFLDLPPSSGSFRLARPVRA